jgi:hydroxypyruvate reductase
VDYQQRRSTLIGYLDRALSAVDPETLTSNALAGITDRPVSVIAIGKAAPAMCRGAALALGHFEGICVAAAIDDVPEGVELFIGDHPVPGERSLAVGKALLDFASRADGHLVALISGGGSALCEHPIDGVSPELIITVNQALLAAGASIEEMNLVRSHLSRIKGGGLAKAAGRGIATYAISDVCGAEPSVIASGPTIPHPHDPETAEKVMTALGISVTAQTRSAMSALSEETPHEGPVSVLADGHTAADALVEAAAMDGVEAVMMDEWLLGPVDAALESFLAGAGPGLTVAAGEPEVRVTGDGVGGRNTHAALLAATRLVDADATFAAFATDGVDGTASSAGAIVDGETVRRGGDPTPALECSDSATYLESTGDLIVTGPTGTNVADLWAVWR